MGIQNTYIDHKYNKGRYEPMNKVYKIAAIPGDGIGIEVLPEGLKVLQAAADKHQIALDITQFDWASCDYYLEHGSMLPDNWFEVLKNFDAVESTCQCNTSS